MNHWLLLLSTHIHYILLLFFLDVVKCLVLIRSCLSHDSTHIVVLNFLSAIRTFHSIYVWQPYVLGILLTIIMELALTHLTQIVRQGLLLVKTTHCCSGKLLVPCLSQCSFSLLNDLLLHRYVLFVLHLFLVSSHLFLFFLFVLL